MNIIKGEISHRWMSNRSACVGLIVLSLVWFISMMWRHHYKPEEQSNLTKAFGSGIFSKTAWSSKSGKQEKKWLTSTIEDEAAKMENVDVTAAFADDPELKSVKKFTIDPLVPFFPNEIYRTNPDGTSYENWMAMDFPPRGTTWDKHYRTPCFTNATDGRFRCTPKVYVVGWLKCGTTEMWWYMSHHPELAHSKCKETEFMTFRNFKDGEKQMFTFDELLEQWFDEPSRTIIKSNPEKILFDASVTTALSNWHWQIKQGYAGDPDIPTHTTFHYLRKVNPSIQIIALVRNPATAALSLFNHGMKMHLKYHPELPKFFKQPKTAKDIHDYFVQSIRHFNECVTKSSLRACCHLSDYDRNTISDPKYFYILRIYIYYIYLEEVFKNFPPSQVHLIKSEEFYEDEQSTLHKLFVFLKISTDQARILVNAKKGHVSNDRPPYIQPAVETYQMLSEFYKPFNRRLAKMLGEKKWLKWEKESEQFIAKMKSNTKK